MERSLARTLSSLVAVASLAGCVGASADTAVPAEQGVVVSISSATLAEDCNPAAGGKGMADTKGKSRRAECQQTAVQLALASGAAGSGPLTIEKAQLFDISSGALLQTMTTRNPQLWTGGRYAPWNAVVKPNEKAQVSYDMNAPDWSKLGGTRMAAQGKTFRLEVTVRIGGELKKVGSTVRSAELMVEPIGNVKT